MFSIKLKELRKKNGITQIDLARSMNVANGTIGNWESGTREPDFDMLSKLANFFGVSIDYLLKDDGEIETENDNQGQELKVALFGGDTEVTDEMWNEVMNYAEFLKQKYKKN